MTRPLAYEPRYALNAICPYFTMFPLEYPLRVLKKHKKEGAVVMDPFCGRGTTLFAARTLGMTARGFDTSPVAVAIARAKLCNATTETTLELARHLIETVTPLKIPDTAFFQHCFHEEVLVKLCAIREGLLAVKQDTDGSVLLRAAMLGCLHGPLSKGDTNRAYFSNQMPRTFASKPEYSVKYWTARDMSAPNVDVIRVLERKLARLNASAWEDESTFANVRHADSRFATNLPDSSRDFSVVVTSPPYYGMRTYVEDQWLRNWFLGGPAVVAYRNEAQLEHSGQATFAKSLGSVWKNMARTKASTLDLYVRFGIIPSAKVDARALMRASLEESGVNWRIVSVRAAETAEAGKRQAAQMSAGSAAATEYDFHVVRA